MTANSERHSESLLRHVSNVCKQLMSHIVSRASCQPMGKTEFSSTAKNRTSSVVIDRNSNKFYNRHKVSPCNFYSFVDLIPKE